MSADALREETDPPPAGEGQVADTVRGPSVGIPSPEVSDGMHGEEASGTSEGSNLDPLAGQDSSKPQPDIAGPCRGQPPHPPIRIQEEAGDEGFVIADGTPTYRPGSGVVAGLGTEEAPYVIEGWCIDARHWEGSKKAPDQRHGIVIDGTDAHVRIEGVNVLAHPGNGVHVERASNVTVAGSDLHYNNGSGVRLETGATPETASHSIAIHDNTLARNWGPGVHLDGWTRDSVVGGNEIVENQNAGIRAFNPRNVTIEDNEIADNGHGVQRDGHGLRLTGAQELTIVGNRIEENGGRNEDGINFWGSARGNDISDNRIVDQDTGISFCCSSGFGPITDNTIRGNLVRDHRKGLISGSTGAHLVAGNTFTQNGVGLQAGGDDVVRDNNVTGNRDGMVLRGQAEAHHNNVEDNGRYGLLGLDGDGPIDATLNWWGCKQGPGDPDCDVVSGDVEVDPWLEAPNEDAGARESNLGSSGAASGGEDPATGASATPEADAGPPIQAPADCGLCENHPPIRVTADEGRNGFVLAGTGTPSPAYRPGSGVTAGSGTAEDPYVVDGWVIDGEYWEGSSVAPDQDSGIYIANTDAHVEIRGNELWRNDRAGVRIVNATNVTVTSNLAIQNDEAGIQVQASTHVDVVSNTATRTLETGIRVIDSDQGAVRANELNRIPEGTGIELVDTRDWEVAANRVNQTSVAIHLAGDSDGNRVSGNHVHGVGFITDVEKGILLDGVSNGNVVEGNSLSSVGAGIRAWHGGPNTRGGGSNTIAGNTVEDSGTGYHGVSTTHNVVRNNTFRTSVTGVEASGGDLVEGNRLTDNINGLEIPFDDDGVTARDNVISGNIDGIEIGPEVQDLEIQHNLVSDNRVGVKARGSGSNANEVQLNEIRHNGVGIRIEESPFGRINENNVHDNRKLGLDATGVSTTLDATDNWWGCQQGPTDSDCDSVDGDAVYDPWRESPNPDAGPR